MRGGWGRRRVGSTLRRHGVSSGDQNSGQTGAAGRRSMPTAETQEHRFIIRLLPPKYRNIGSLKRTSPFRNVGEEAHSKIVHLFPDVNGAGVLLWKVPVCRVADCVASPV